MRERRKGSYVTFPNTARKRTHHVEEEVRTRHFISKGANQESHRHPTSTQIMRQRESLPLGILAVRGSLEERRT